MDKNEAMDKIRESLKKLISFSEVATDAGSGATASGATASDGKSDDKKKKFESVTANDGTVINYPDGSELEVGTELVTVDADGNETPLEDGTYELQDGRTLTVSGGVVESISGVGASNGEETPIDDAKMDATQEAEGQDGSAEDDSNDDGSLQDRVSALENTMAEILELLQGMSSAQEMAMSKIQEIASAPAAESIKIGKTVENNFSKTSSNIEYLRDIKKKYNIGASGNGFKTSVSNK